MATIKDTAATSALNEDKYINELYDTNLQNQNKVMQESFDNDNAVLDTAQQGVGQQTSQYIDRTNVEAKKAADLYGYGGVSAGAQAQVGLSQENAQRRNVNTLRDAQANADAEYQRQRQLRAKQFEAEIKQAQADNDMARAQALYEAAKAEDAQLRELQRKGAELMYRKKKDMSGFHAIAAGETIPRDTEGVTWDEVLKGSDDLNAIYDAELEAAMTRMQSEYETSLSDLEASRQTKEQATDAKLTDAYVDALRSQKNNAEMMNTYGRSSGAAAQGRLSSDISLQDTLTDIRRAKLEADTAAGKSAFELSTDYGSKRAQAQHDTDLDRAEALYEDAEEREQQLVADQLMLGELYAKKRDYDILGLLYGLTPDQIDKIQGTGKYASKSRGTSVPRSRNSGGNDYKPSLYKDIVVPSSGGIKTNKYNIGR